MPASSFNLRLTACSNDSSSFTKPPGNAQNFWKGSNLLLISSTETPSSESYPKTTASTETLMDCIILRNEYANIGQILLEVNLKYAIHQNCFIFRKSTLFKWK